MSLRQIVVACLVYVTTTALSFGQPIGFTCPKAGTVEQLAVSTITYTGASASDPTICTLTNRLGKPEERLFNFYLLSNINNNPTALAPMKAGLSDLLSGKTTSTTILATNSDGYVETDKWTFLRKEPVQIGDKTYNALVFDREVTADPRATSGFHGHYTHWVDPKAGIWLKAGLTGASGATNHYPQAFRIHTLTVP